MYSTDMYNEHRKKTYVCNRLRMAEFLRNQGFLPYKIAPDHNDPKRNVFLYNNTQELCGAVMDYLNTASAVAEKTKNKVTVEIKGGVVWSIDAPPNVEVIVRDLDDEDSSVDEEEPDAPSWPVAQQIRRIS